MRSSRNRVLLWVLTPIVLTGVTACNKTTGNPSVAQDQGPAGNPADGGLAPVSQTATQTQQPSAAPQPYSSSQTDQSYAPADYQEPTYDAASNQQPVYAPDPPPPLPEYQQPPCPGDDYVWNPGYWDYSSAGYYWVPGAWVIAPYVGALWTPPWWGFYNGRYILHPGYWGPNVGFYGGIDYGFGYTGHGYWGGYWNHGHIWYNRDATNVNVANNHNVYNYTPPRYNNTRVSYNGGRGGVNIRPLPAEQVAVREAHTAPVPAQVQHVRQAESNRAQFAAENHGNPQTVAAARPLPTNYHAPAARGPEEAPRAPAEAERRSAEAARPAPAERAPETRAQLQQQPSRGPENRPVPENRAAAENRPAPAARPVTPENRPAPEAKPNPLARPAPQARPEARPAPEAKPEARPAPAPRAIPESRPEARPAPAARPEERAQPQARPAPAARPVPEARPEVRPAPEARPAPQPAARPTPEAHPAAPKPAGRGEERKEER